MFNFYRKRSLPGQLLQAGLIVTSLLMGRFSSLAQATRYRQTAAYSITTATGTAGYNHTIEVRGGYLLTYGDNTYGQLGIGSTTDQSEPQQVGTADNWVTAAGGDGFTIAVKSDGTLWSFGRNDHGQLGLGTTDQQTEPQQIGTDNHWSAVTAGSSHVLAIKTDGTLWSWGRNQFGEAGIGNTTEQTAPVQIGTDNNWATIAAGWNASIAIRSNGTLWSWGINDDGQLGDGTQDAHDTPTQIGTDANWQKADLGEHAAIALKTDGTLWVWGNNANGNFGNGTTDNSLSPIQTGTAHRWKKINFAQTHVAAICADGTLWVFGDNTAGQLGNGQSGSAANSTMLQVGTGNNWTELYSGIAHAQTFAVTVFGTTFAFGTNTSGELGNGTTDPQLSPLETGTNTDLAALELGANYTTIQRDGHLWAAGSNGSFQIGNGNVVTTNVPVPLPVLNPQIDHVTSYAAAYATGLVVKTDGTLWAWGQNNNGQIGDGTTTNRPIIVQVGTDSDWSKVYAGYNFVIALKSNGTLWAWGQNTYAQLGMGTTEMQTAPIQIGTDADWIAIAPGTNFVMAIKSNGTLWGWGQNNNGQLGNGTNFSQPTPLQSGTDNNWIAIATGDAHTLGLKSDGTLWTWGQNGSGQLGTGNTTSLWTPTQLGTDTDWGYVAGGGFGAMSLAIKSDGSAYTWGGNLFGQLGVGPGVFQQTTPVLIPAAQGAIAADAGLYHAGIMKADKRSLCMSGYNSLGCLANGTGANSNVFLCNIMNTTTLVPAESISVEVQNGGAPEITANGGTLQLTAVVLPAQANQNVIWSLTSTTGEATISTTGLVTAQTDGTVWAKAVSVENATLTDSIEITITNQVNEAVALFVSTENAAPAVISTDNGTLQLVAEITPLSANQDVTWTIIAETGTATISAAGLVTAQTDGTIWAKAVSVENSLLMDSIQITISDQVLEVESITVTTFGNMSPVILMQSGTLQLEATVLPSNSNQQVVWSVSNNSGSATISATGLVTAQANGTVWGIATSVENSAISDSILVTISGQSGVGITETAAATFIAWPNPAANELSVSGLTSHKDMTVVLTDGTGKVVVAQQLNGLEAAIPYTIDLSAIATGIYNLEISGADVSFRTRVVKH